MATSAYRLQRNVVLGGETYEIRTDYSVIMDIIEALRDQALNEQERAEAVLTMFYTEPETIPEEYLDDAVESCFAFLRGGRDTSKKNDPVLVDWKKDFPLIVAPVNRVLGYDIRDVDYDEETNAGGVHWHTVLSAYMEIGDCFFAQIVGIRSKKARGKPLDKQDREFYKKNQELIDMDTDTVYTEADENILKEWT